MKEYYLSNKTKILGISEVKTFKMVNYTSHGCFSSTSKVFQECRPKKSKLEHYQKQKNKEYIKLIFFYKKHKQKNNCNKTKIFTIKPKNDII